MPVFRPPRPRSAWLALCTAVILAVSLLALFLLLSAFASPALAHSARAPYAVDGGTEGQTVFTREDGLPANSVTALLRDDTVLWVGTMAGLSRYTVAGRDAGLVWENFYIEDGMATDAVSDLWSDESGGLWVAHPDRSISFFDGDTWMTYDTLTQTLVQAYKQIVDTRASGPLWAIEEGGRVWTLADGTVGYYVGAVWRPYGADAGIPRGRLVAVWAGDGAWVASDTGQIGYFDGATWTAFGNVFDAVQRQYETIVASGPMVGPIWLVDQDGAVWIRNAFNQRNPRPDVRRFAEGRWTNFSTNNGMADGFVAELRLDQFGRVWARHVADNNGAGGGLSLFVGDQAAQSVNATSWIAFVPPFSSNVTDFWPEGTDGVWISSYFQPQPVGAPVGGLTHVDLNTWQFFSLGALDGAAVGDTWLDEANTLWMGLASDPFRGLDGGLWRYQPPQGVRFARWTPVTDLLDGDVRDLWGDSAGSLWVATAGGVNRINLSNRRLVSYTQPLDPDQVMGDGTGNVWALSLGEAGGVWQWNGDVWASQTVSEGLSGGSYNDMIVATDGRVYLGGDRGLDIWTGDEWETFAALPGRYVRHIWRDQLGDLWVSSEITPGRPFNLSLKSGTAWKTILREEGSSEMGPEALALTRDSGGHVWLGTSLGLFVYDLDEDARWQGLGQMEGFVPGPVTAIYEDASGMIWTGTGEQVYRTDHRFCAPVCAAWHRFEPGVGTVSQISAGPEGSVFIAGDSGVALYYPNAPELRLEGIVNLITGDVSDGAAPVVLTVGRSSMRIDLATIASTLNSRQIAYRYRLEGVDEDWHLVPASALGGKKASITYAGLAGGVYTFTAAARTDALDASSEISFAVYVVSRPPELFLSKATVAGRAMEQPSALRASVGQPIQIQLSSADDQSGSLTYRYRIEGLNDNWTSTQRSEVSFTLSAAGTYTFVAMALDGEGQSSPLVGSHIVITALEPSQDSDQLPVATIAVGMGMLAALFIGSAIYLILKRRRRESW